MAARDEVVINGKRYNVTDILTPWLNRRDQAEKAIKPFLPQVRINRMFAAGKQNLEINQRDLRVREVNTRRGVELVTSNMLDQYLMTVLGRLASHDYKPNFLVSRDNPEAEEIARLVNLAFTWGWENEWMGDQKVLDLLRHLVIDGTVAIRCRYDRRYGEIVGDMPFKDGVPITDRKEAAKYIAEKAEQGEQAEIHTIRTGKIVWELVTIDNILPEPGVYDPALLKWHIIRRPVSVADLRHRYGKLAEDVNEEVIEDASTVTASLNEGQSVRVEGHAMLYTGYEEPSSLHPEGREVVFTETALLDVKDYLPLAEHPLGPRTGLHYFRWSVLPGRFVGKAFIENGIGPQKIYNKRHTQINAIIDRNMPVKYVEENSLARRATGEPMEIVEVRPGAPLPRTEAGVQPGQWLMDDVKAQVDAAERALGIRGVSMGSAPQGVSAYSAMALLTENDALKLDPFGREFQQTMDALCWDTVEQMRNWPDSKRLDIVGPDNKLAVVYFNASDIPDRYVLRRPSGGGSLPRSQAAEIQKVNDIWAAAQGKLPLSWYVTSLNAGKPQELPPSIGDADAHKAELENIIIMRTGSAPPVAPYDDDERHVEIHRAAQIEAKARADAGDESAVPEVEAFEAHILEHEQSAKQGMTPPTDMPAMPMPPPQPAQPTLPDTQTAAPLSTPGGAALDAGMPSGMS